MNARNESEVELTGMVRNGRGTMPMPIDSDGGGSRRVKPLDSEFRSFGEALYAWTNSDGFEHKNNKTIDMVMLRSILYAQALRFAAFNCNFLFGPSSYFKDETWLVEWLKKHQFKNLGWTHFIKLDAFNRPVFFVKASRDSFRNFTFEAGGLEEITSELLELTKANIHFDPSVTKKSTLLEITTNSNGELEYKEEAITNERDAELAYYPYMDGGVIELLKSFIESDETVLVLKGVPGTGKTSAISAGVTALNLLPIYAKKAKVLKHVDLINYIFGLSDGYMAKVGGTEARTRSDLFDEIPVISEDYKYTEKVNDPTIVDYLEKPRIPVVIIEDGDLLLAPRSQGNERMAELLNATDGVASNHTRKLIITTNLLDDRDIDSALIRPGRCYDVVNFRNLTPTEAIAARAQAGLPPFETIPTNDVSLAFALRKPRKKICLSEGRASLGFTQAK